MRKKNDSKCLLYNNVRQTKERVFPAEIIFVGMNSVSVLSRYKELLDGKTQLEEREREMNREREKMEAGAQRRLEGERDLERLKDDNDR